MTTFTLSNTLLGQGTYGSVYLATDETGRKVAVKCCTLTEEGIPNILEANIMATFVHPGLNRALRIEATKEKLYFIQELAQADLAHHTRRDRGRHRATIPELKKWCWTIAQGVAALHQHDIIHADIKASNILLYENGDVRLSDFTLATKQWSVDEKFTHAVGTLTHRPPESLRKQSWDKSYDIWALACTWYEIAYGELLFPYQGGLEEKLPAGASREQRRARQLRLQHRALNAILVWSGAKPEHQLNFLKTITPLRYRDPLYSQFNTLLLSMLKIEAEERPTIETVLKHPFFGGFNTPTYLTVLRPPHSVSKAELRRVTRYLDRYSTGTIRRVAEELYRRCTNCEAGEHLLVVTCVWIASKLVVGYPPSEVDPNVFTTLLEVERTVCRSLNFRLCV